MPTGKTVTAADLSTQPLFEEAKLRGRVYRATELSIGDYDKLVAQATKEVESFPGGPKNKETDNELLLKLMVLRCVTEDGERLTPARFADLGTRVIFKLNNIVNRLHYADEPDELKKDKKDKKDEEQEEDAEGNG